MKKTNIIITVLVLLLAVGVSAVTLQGTQTVDEMTESIVKACSGINSLKCDVAQTRRTPFIEEPSKSYGTMLFIKPSRFCLNYNDPYKWILKVDGKNIVAGFDEAELDGDIGRLYKSISDMILGCMSGELLKDKRTFRVTVTDTGDEWKAVLIPVRRDMKKIFDQIELGFDPQTRLLRRLVMNDSAGGITEILVSNVKLNGDYEAEW